MKNSGIIFVVIIVTLLSGCRFVNYSFVGGSIDPKIKTISIQYFPNNAPLVQPALSQLLTEALREKFSQQTKLTTVSRGGDLNIEGSIVNYSTQPIAIQGNETAAMNRLTIVISVKFTNNIDEKQNFEQTFTRYADYLSSLNLSAVEESLIKEINDQFVDDIFNKTVINW
ncbi:MAG TPA: LptE family protein [Bacteroidales bacterium]|nr:LptE family protein [Bacteroidales bacterium]HPS16129.1 LptE family protein [Bacteroidales bacterium]